MPLPSLWRTDHLEAGEHQLPFLEKYPTKSVLTVFRIFNRWGIFDRERHHYQSQPDYVPFLLGGPLCLELPAPACALFQPFSPPSNPTQDSLSPRCSGHSWMDLTEALKLIWLHSSPLYLCLHPASLPLIGSLSEISDCKRLTVGTCLTLSSP